MRKIHSILTYQTENKRKVCINRDRNSVYNMAKLTYHFLETGERLERYRRGFSLDEEIKAPNRCKKPSNGGTSLKKVQ